MPDDVNDRLAELEDTNARLEESLQRCRELLEGCSAKLTANANDDEKSAAPATQRSFG